MPGMAATLIISKYGIPVISDMTKAPAPITGGMIAAPVEAAASTAAAMWDGKPARFISGIVIGPLVTVSAIGLPLMVPISALETTEACAGPPTIRPRLASEIS